VFVFVILGCFFFVKGRFCFVTGVPVLVLGALPLGVGLCVGCVTLEGLPHCYSLYFLASSHFLWVVSLYNIFR
jgi:hypothetical protein